MIKMSCLLSPCSLLHVTLDAQVSMEAPIVLGRPSYLYILSCNHINLTLSLFVFSRLVRVTLDAQTSVMPVEAHIILGRSSYLGFRPDETNMEGRILLIKC